LTRTTTPSSATQTGRRAPALTDRRALRRRLPHLIAIALAAIPGLALTIRFALEGPGANPVEDITHVSGEWALRCVLASLAVTPARRLFGWRWVAPLRRTLGLAGFTWAVVHVATWALLDHGLALGAIAEDLTERPYVMAGMAAFAVLLALAITSTRGWQRQLGPQWTRLHRVVYLAAALAVVHHFWLIKADYRPAIVHGTLLAGLLGARLAWRLRSKG
jgi:sulfoxide reductase heme-binding subunit YedZ